MKKILIGLAAGALAVTAMTAPVSAGYNPASDSVYDVVSDQDILTLLVDSAGLDDALDTCGNGKPQYTVFVPLLFTDGVWNMIVNADLDTAGDVFLGKVGLTLGQLLAQPALIKALLLYHVVPSEILPAAMEDSSNTKFATMGGLTLLKTYSAGTGQYFVNGIEVDLDGYDVCNGYVYFISGVLAPNNDLATIGLTNDGSTTQAAATGEGLPATGSESLALTYAALASLLAGAGVLVIRRRSVA